MRKRLFSPATILLLLMLGMAMAGLSLASRLELDASLRNLLPREQPSVRALADFEERVGGYALLSALVRGQDANVNREIASRLTLEFERFDWVSRVIRKPDADFVRARWPFLIDERQLASLVEEGEDALRQAKVRSSPLAIDLDSVEGKDSWRSIRQQIQEFWPQSEDALYSNPDGTVYLVQFQLRTLTTDIDKLRNILGEIERVTQRIRPVETGPAAQIDYFGGLFFRILEHDTLRSDLRRISAVAIPLILLIPAVAFRSLWGPALIFIPAAVGLALSYAVTYLVFGSLNLVTALLLVVLFGAGIDYPMYLFFETRRLLPGESARGSIGRVLKHTVPPLVFSALTSIAAFLPLSLMQFQGFAQFGSILAIGVICILISSVACYPGLVTVLEKQICRVPGTKRSVSPRREKPRLARAFLLIWLLLVAASASLVMARLQFEDDFDNLRPEFTEQDQLEQRASQVEGYRRSNPPAVFLAEDVEASRQISSALQQRANERGVESPIREVIGLGVLLNNDTPERRQWIGRLVRLLDDPLVREAPEDVLPDLISIRRTLDVSALDLQSLPPGVRSQGIWSGQRGSHDFFPVVAEPRGEISYVPAATAFAAAISNVEIQGREVVPASEALILADITRLIETESPKIFLASVLLISAVCWLSFRSLLDVAALLIVVFGSILLTAGVLVTFGLKLNFFGVAVCPLFIGVAVDYGIHIVHHARQSGRSLAEAVSNLAPPMVASTCTTTMGFAALLFAQHPGLRSMGLAGSLGTIFIACSCAFALPALLKELHPKQWKPSETH